MEKFLHTKHLNDLWLSLSEMVKAVLGATEMENVEISVKKEIKLVTNDIKNDQLYNLRLFNEVLDELHESLAISKDQDSRGIVRRAYLELCRNILKVEMNERQKLINVINIGNKSLSNLSPRLMKSSLSHLEEVVKTSIEVSSKLKIRASNVIGVGLISRLLLISDQIMTALRLLLKAITELEFGAGVPLIQIKTGVSFVINLLKTCMKEASTVEGKKDKELICGKFVSLVDDLLASIEGAKEINENITELCEEMISHAMSVANVAVANDSENITTAAQKVLCQLNGARNEENSVLRTLRIGALEDSIMALEQVVSTALLRLVLDVFSELCEPLNKLMNNIQEEEIKEFDLHVDRIMQAGLFAAECSSDAQSVAGVQSCLASLESLEAELVPALQTKGSLQLARFYASHWKCEVKRLSEHLDYMVDPITFIQVAVEEFSRLKISMTPDTDQERIIESTHVIVKYARKIYNLLKSSKDIKCDEKTLEDIDLYIKELHAATKSKMNEKWHDRIIKRIKLLEYHLKALGNELSEDGNTEEKSDTSTDKLTIEETNKIQQSIKPEKICMTPGKRIPATPLVFPDSVTDLPLDIATPNGGVDLTPFVVRGKKLCDNRSVLYKTPQRLLTKSNNGDNVDIPRLQLFVGENEETLNLNVTEILDGLSGLSETLSSAIFEQTGDLCVLRNSKIGASLRLRSKSRIIFDERLSMSMSTAPSLGSQIVTSVQREADLRFLDEKIKRLKSEINAL